jgi:WhiB family redox-sensing transcriptional regulator
MPADMFFPVGTTGAAQDELAAARAVCSGCDVRPHCLDFSLATRQEFGIWGGMDEEERRHLLRDSRAPRRLR